jgi:hypothetical protein
MSRHPNKKESPGELDSQCMLKMESSKFLMMTSLCRTLSDDDVKGKGKIVPVLN